MTCTAQRNLRRRLSRSPFSRFEFYIRIKNNVLESLIDWWATLPRMRQMDEEGKWERGWEEIERKKESRRDHSLTLKAFPTKFFVAERIGFIKKSTFLDSFSYLCLSVLPPLLVTLFCRKAQGIEEYEKSKETSQFSTIAPFTTLPLILDSFSLTTFLSLAVPQFLSSLPLLIKDWTFCLPFPFESPWNRMIKIIPQDALRSQVHHRHHHLFILSKFFLSHPLFLFC